MTLKLPIQVENLCAQLEQAGFEAYVVGGATRDLLRGVTPKDYDIATSATPQEVQSIFTKTIPTGIKYGTITVIIDGVPIEVTTFRSDVAYDDKRRPTQVIFNKDIKEDLSRRDFTINAIAYRPVTMQIVDPFGGQKDLQDKIIRCVGIADARFEEDALRMMRALRFLAVLPGFSMDVNTISAVSRKSPLIRCVSRERIWQELSKTLLGEQASKSMDAYFKSGLAYEITRREYDSRVPAKKNLIKNFDALPNNLSTRFAAFSLMRGYASAGFVSDFGEMDRKVTSRSLDLLKIQHFEAKTNPKEEYARRWIKQVGKDAAEDAIQLYFYAEMITDEDKKVLSEQLSLNPAVATHELAISGEKLLEMCEGVGGWVGDTYRFLLDAVIKYPENNSEHRMTELAKMHINKIRHNK